MNDYLNEIHYFARNGMTDFSKLADGEQEYLVAKMLQTNIAFRQESLASEAELNREGVNVATDTPWADMLCSYMEAVNNRTELEVALIERIKEDVINYWAGRIQCDLDQARSLYLRDAV